MKLALVRRQYSATGGAELYLERLTGALAREGHELHVFAESWGQPPAGITVHPIPTHGSRAERPVSFAQAVKTELERHTFDCVFSLERTLKQDVYRAGDGVHKVWLQRRHQFAPWWRKPFTSLGAFHRNMMALEAQTFDPRNTRHIIVNSEMVKREIRAHFNFPDERIHLVHNGVEASRFESGDRRETRARFGFGKQDFVMLFVGSGAERKGLSYVINAHRALEELRQAMEEMSAEGVPQEPIVGMNWESSFTPAHLPNKASKLLIVGKNKKPSGELSDVVFAGPMSKVQDAYAAADLFVFLPIYEPASNVVSEALAAGLPVVTSAYNGAAELIQQNVNGTVVADPSNRSEVIRAMLYWMKNRHQFRTVSSEALSLERNVNETVKVLELAAREKRA